MKQERQIKGHILLSFSSGGPFLSNVSHRTQEGRASPSYLFIQYC